MILSTSEKYSEIGLFSLYKLLVIVKRNFSTVKTFVFFSHYCVNVLYFEILKTNSVRQRMHQLGYYIV